VDKIRRLKRVIGALLAKQAARQPSQFTVDRRQQLLQRFPIAAIPAIE
jgi:hypothetical protein